MRSLAKRVGLLAANAAAIAAGLGLGLAMRTDGRAADPGAVPEVAPAEHGREPEAAPQAFRRPLVVPVAEGWRGQSLVVIEAGVSLPHADTMTREAEARTRDALVAALATLSAEGRFADPMPEDREGLEAALTAAAGPVLPGARVTVAKVSKKPV